MGDTYDAAGLEIAYFHPTEQTWVVNDREIVCVLVDELGEIREGSPRGA